MTRPAQPPEDDEMVPTVAPVGIVTANEPPLTDTAFALVTVMLSDVDPPT